VNRIVSAATLAGVAVVFLMLTADARPEGKPTAVAGFKIEAIAHLAHPRELAATPNGDLIVGTDGPDVYVVPDAERKPGAPSVFAHLDDDEASGVALGAGALYVGTTFGVWKIPYANGERHARATPVRLMAVRTGGGGGHSTTSVAVSNDTLYAAVGSSCNACEESDPTRAAIQRMSLDGSNVRARAVHIRNAIALAVDPATQDLWAGAAGQDELAHGHPYEIFDNVGSRAGTPNYGWPTCYENRTPVRHGVDCANVTVPLAAFPAYATPIGAAFYPASAHGRFAFPQEWRDGVFVTLHGSWHRPPVPPLVVFVPVKDGVPAVAVDWTAPAKQWKPFIDGWQNADGRRSGRPTGVTVSEDGSLFVADDDGDTIFRIRPNR